MLILLAISYLKLPSLHGHMGSNSVDARLLLVYFISSKSRSEFCGCPVCKTDHERLNRGKVVNNCSYIELIEVLEPRRDSDSVSSVSRVH